MILVVNPNASAKDLESLKRILGDEKISYSEATLEGLSVLNLKIDKQPLFDFSNFRAVWKVINLKPEYEKVARKTKKETTRIQVGDAVFDENNFVLIAGPCSIENIDQAYEIGSFVKKNGATILRGGAYKPRTSPYSFQGLGQDGLNILSAIKKDIHIPIITEIMDTRDFDRVHEVADILQVGTRNMQNFSLLKELGKAKKPVLLKRGLSATVKEWLLSAEYILNHGNSQVILCERGVRSFDSETRNLLDLASVSLVKSLSHLPVIVDPSHALGRSDIIEPMSAASMAAGSYGVMVEVNNVPERALSDGAQALNYEQFAHLSQRLKKLSLALDIRMV